MLPLEAVFFQCTRSNILLSRIQEHSPLRFVHCLYVVITVYPPLLSIAMFAITTPLFYVTASCPRRDKGLAQSIRALATILAEDKLVS